MIYVTKRRDQLDAPYHCPAGRCHSFEPFEASHRCSAVPTMKPSASSERGLDALAEILSGAGLSAAEIRAAIGAGPITKASSAPELRTPPWRVTVFRRRS